MSDPQRPHGLQPSRLLHPWDFPGKSTGVGCHCLLQEIFPKTHLTLHSRMSGSRWVITSSWLSGSLSQTCNKKRSWSLFGDLLLEWSTTAFWIPVKPLYLRSMLSKWKRCTENCNTCSWHWSTQRAQFFSATAPDCTLHNQPMLQKLNKLGLPH